MAKVKVTLAQLASPLVVSRVNAGTTIEKFLEANDLNFTDSVQVNGASVRASYKLKNNDIITVATNVSGGTK